MKAAAVNNSYVKLKNISRPYENELIDRIKQKKLSVNSFLIVFLIASKSISSIIHYYTGIYNVLISVSFIILVVIVYFLNNNNYVNKVFIYVICSLALFFCINGIFALSYISVAVREFGKLMVYGGSALLIATVKFDPVCLQKIWFKFSVSFMAILHIMILSSTVVGDFNYMSIGFILNFINVGFILKYIKTRKYRWLLLCFYVFVLVVLLAHRGAILVNLVLIMFAIYVSMRKKMKFFVFLALFLILAIFSIRNDLLLDAYDLITRYLPSLNSRSIHLFLMDIREGSVNLSRREQYFMDAWKMIKEHNFIIPSGFGKFQFVTGRGSAHTIFLDLILIFGGFSIIFLYHFLKSIKDICQRASSDFKIVYWCIFIFAMMELIINTAFFVDFPFWILIGMNLTRYWYYDNRSYKVIH